MTTIHSPRLAADGHTDDLDGEIGDFVRKDVAVLRQPRSEPADEAHNVGTLIERVAGNSMNTIDDVITELQRMQEFIQLEGERVQREIAAFAQVSQAAMNCAEGMSENVAHWKSGLFDARRDRH